MWESLAERLSYHANAELTEFLDGLTPDQRQIITWHHLDGLSHREIGERLGIHEPAARVKLSRAMIALREIAARKEVGR